MSDKQLSVLVDTSFLISLYDDTRPNHKVAKKYHKYFIKHSIVMCLSPIVIAEFHQMQSIVDVVGSGNYRIIPFNYDDGLNSADIAYKLGGVSRKRDGTNPKYKDDLKLIAQTVTEDISFIITEDKSTLARYCTKLQSAKVLNTKVIVLSDAYDESWFNGGQATLVANID
jgi:hypothetical protein